MNVSLILFHCSAQYNYKGKALNVFSHKNGTNWTFTLIALFDNVEHFTDPLPPLFRLIHLGQVIGTDELKLMKREWSPAFSITTGRVLSWFGWGGGACCQDTGPFQSRDPAVILDNTLDPLATPNWPLTGVVTPNQCSHAHGDSVKGWWCLPAGSTEQDDRSVSYKVTSATV